MCFYTSLFKPFSLKLYSTVVLSLLMVACSDNNDSRTIESLTIAVLPHQNESIQRKNYQPIANHINEHLNIPVTLLIPKSYEQLLEWFTTKKVDMAMFGGVTYVKAHLAVQATALVMRDVDSRFKSLVLVRADSSAKDLNDLKGSSIAFGSRLSTSGHFMPRHFFKIKNGRVGAR